MAMDSAYDVHPDNGGRDVCVNSSYCGVLPARFIAEVAPRAAIGMDCGIGPEGSAIAGLWYLEALGIAAAVADVMSALLGDGVDLHDNGVEPFRFDQMRPGCYDVDARVSDMDLAGIQAMLNFPSQVTGFCGLVFATARDRDVGVDAVRAWNDWLYNEWCLVHPTRIIPMGITYLGDPDQAVNEIRRNTDRGFVSVTLPERPHAVGLPSLWDRSYWDPIIAACAETETVISLHVGSSGLQPAPPGDRLSAHRQHMA